MPFLTRRQLLAAKNEGTLGTEEALADADVIAPIFEPSWAPEITFNERDSVQDTLSKIPQVAGERTATIGFSVEAIPSGVADTPPDIGVLLRACGMKETINVATSVVYTPLSATQEGATIELRKGTSDSATVKSEIIFGAMGTWTMEATKGNPVRFTFEFTGKYKEPTEGTQFASPTLPPLPPVMLSAGFLHQGASLVVSSVSVDIANEVGMRNDVNETTGNLSALITGRSPTGSMDPEIPLIATQNIPNLATSDTEGALTFAVDRGTGTGRFTFNAPKAQVTEFPEGDRDGIATHDVALLLNKSADAGDDEISLTFDVAP